KRHVEAAKEEGAERQPVATGPWKFVEHVRGDRIVYEAVENHWRATPHFKRLVFLKVPEPSTRMAMLRAGSVDVIEIGGEYADELKKVGVRTLVMPNVSWLYVILGGQWPTKATYDPKVPWAQADAERARKVRLAMNLAVDKNAIMQRVLGGLGTVMGSWLSYPSDPWASDTLKKPYPYDPAKAKALLAEAGYPNGFEVTMNLTAWPGRGFLPDVGEAVATYWEKVGVKAKRRPVDRAIFAADFRARAYSGVSLAYASPLVAPEPWEGLYRAGYTKAALCLFVEHPKLDEFIDRLAVQPSHPERVRVMRDEMGPWLYEHVPGVAIGATHAIAGLGPKVGEWPLIAGHMGFHNWEYVQRAPRYHVPLSRRPCPADAPEHAGGDQHRLRPDAAVRQSRPPATGCERQRARSADPDAPPGSRPAPARAVRHLRQEHLHGRLRQLRADPPPGHRAHLGAP